MKPSGIGGQAVIEGVMMKGPKKIALAVRNASGRIVEEEWEYDIENLESGYACVNAYNMDEPAFSDIGSVAFKMDPACGGLYII